MSSNRRLVFLLRVACPARLILFYSTVTFILVPHVLLSSPASDTFNQCSSFHVRDVISHSYITTGSNIVLYMVVFTILGSRRKEESGINHSPNVICSTFQSTR
jgi:hypothetical protein